MTASQRAKQNRENASRSTGPTSVEGKEISRRNALKHGLAAEALALPDENPDDIQEQAEAWSEALQPASHDEEILVNQIAVAALRLQRCAKAETEIVAKQVRESEHRWEVDQRVKLIDLTKLLLVEPAKALIELRHFGPGLTWLTERWTDLKEAFEASRCWNSLALIQEAIRLSGYDPERLKDESLDAYEIAIQAISCIVDHTRDSTLSTYLAEQMPARWQGRYESVEYTLEAAMEAIRVRIDYTLDELKLRAESLDEDEEASRRGARIRAAVPADTPANRLFLRYLKSTETGFERTLKTLAKLQADRGKVAKKAAEEAPKVSSRNEAESPAKPSPTSFFPGSYVTLKGADYEVVDVSDGTLVLVPVDPPDMTAVLEYARASKPEV